MKQINQEFYGTIIEAIGQTTKTTKEFYEIITNTKTQYGLSDSTTPESTILKRLCDILGSKMTSMDDTEIKGFGRQQPKLYCLACSTEQAKEALRDYYWKVNSTKGHHRPRQKKLNAMGNLEEISAQIYQSHPRKSTFDSLYRLLVPMENSRVDIIKPSMSYNAFKSIIASFKRSGVNISVNYVENNGESFRVKFNDFDTLMIELRKKALEWYGLYLTKSPFNPGIASAAALLTCKLPERKAPIINKERLIPTKIETSTENTKVFFIVAGLIKSMGNRALALDAVCKTLREDYSMNITSLELVNILKQEEQFSIIRNQLVSFKDINTSCEIINSKYNPSHYTFDLYMRLGMSLDCVKEYFQNAEIFSEISSNDNIYKICVDSSQHTFSKLLKLYLTFRGTDTIIGNKELAEQLDKQSRATIGLWNNNNPMYQLEASMSR